MVSLAPAEVLPACNSDHTKLLSLTEDGSTLKLDQALFSIGLENGQRIDSMNFTPLNSSKSQHPDLIHRPTGLACRWKTVVTPDKKAAETLKALAAKLGI